MKPALCVPSVSTMPGLIEFTRIFLRSKFLCENTGDGFDRSLDAGINRTVRRGTAAHARSNINDAGVDAEVLDGRLRDKQKAEYVNVEYLVELVFRDRFNRRELIHAGVIHQDVEATVVLDGRIDDALGFGGLRDVTTYGNRFAARLR